MISFSYVMEIVSVSSIGTALTSTWKRSHGGLVVRPCAGTEYYVLPLCLQHHVRLAGGWCWFVLREKSGC
jgi:hypothetical protein